MDKNTLLNISKNMQYLTFVLAKKNYDKIGALSNIDQNTVVYKKTMHGMELSFDVYKELDGVQEKLWYELTDFKLVWLKEINEYFQITVSTDELSYTKKTVTATSLCEAELSQVNLYNIEINTEDDIARDDYKITTFYNMDDPEASLIHRILSKVPQYTIKHVDSSLSKIQRSFSVDGTSILDFLNGDCSEQFNCLFTFDSTDRSVSVYDLYVVCKDCGERDDMSNFTHIDKNGSLTYTCPKCGSHNVKYYGEDTKIFVDNENLTDEVQLETDTDSVKNCFKLVAGDDLMTATVQLLNMNGSDYIYYVSDEQKKDMPKELVDKIESYDKLCASYNAEYESLVSQIYEASTKLYYYRNSMMPTIEQATATAATEAAKLTAQNLSPLGLSSASTSTSKATVESALKNYAKVYVKSGYVKLEINDSSFSYNGTDSLGNHYGTWTGNFKVTNYSDETDIAFSSTISVKVYDNYQDFIEQKIKKTILNDANDDDSIFDVLNINNLDNFKEALTYYCLNRLKSFYDAVQSALDVLVQMNQGVKGAIAYDSLYVPYYNKLQACQAEIDKRQVSVDEWQTKYDNAVSRQQEIQKILNFEDYIGSDLYKLFCCYRREDTYQNDNYISDGLEDQEVIDRAKEFLEVAKKELVKSSTMQHSISTTLYNLLCIPEFKRILNSFEVGNWIRVRVDGEIYKLRLIQYEISFSNMNTISVEFSDVTKIQDSLTDFQSLVKDTQSISSSYSYISKQADAGHKASVNMDKIVEDGLNSALVNIKNNNREEITYNKHGILCREYDDISDDYSDEQLLITHNILAMTDDNWETCSLGLGKHEYIYYDGNTFVKDVGYGMSAKFCQSAYIYGSQIISGDIYSSNYSPTTGSHINLKDGSFSFAGGKFVYDPDKDIINMTNGNIIGGSLNLGNGTFTVDNNGNMVAKSGTFSGNGDGLTFQSNATINELSSQIKQTAESISTEITNRQNADIQLSSSITQTAEQISLKVSKGEVSSEISMENSQIVISGDRIIIDSTNFKLSETGGVKASDIYILGGMITGSVIVSENYYERDENGDLILGENVKPIETGEGTIINLMDGTSSFAGEYNYAWLDEEAEVHKAKIDLGKGRLVIEDLDKSKKLYYSYEGISTTEDGNDASGVVDFRSGMFGQSKGGTTYSGITVKTKGSPVALLSETNHCIISPRKLQGIMDNSDMATWDKFVFGLWNRYEVDSGGQPDYTQKRDTVRAGNGYIAFGKRKYDESTDEYDYGTILEFGSKNENGGDYGTVYVNDKNNGQGKGKIIASNIPKAVVDVVVTQNESRQITKLVCTLEDGDKENIAVEYDSSGNVTKIGGTTISGWS